MDINEKMKLHQWAIVKVNIKLLFFGGVNCRFWSNLSSPYHQTGACL